MCVYVYVHVCRECVCTCVSLCTGVCVCVCVHICVVANDVKSVIGI